MDDVLSKWEAEAGERPDRPISYVEYDTSCERIIALIELVRKKDNQLRAIVGEPCVEESQIRAKVSLALTDSLK